MAGESPTEWANTAPRPNDFEGFQFSNEPEVPRFKFEPTDTEVALNSMAVRLPEEPVWVNGSPYGFFLHPHRLARPVNKNDRTMAFRGEYLPRSLTLTLDTSIPKEVIDSEKPAHFFDTDTNDLSVTIPRELTESKCDDDEIVKQVELIINEGVRLGLEQNEYMRGQFFRRRAGLKAGLLLSGVIGEGAGIASISAANPGLDGYIGRGAAGFIVGNLVFGAMMTGKVIANKVRFGGDRAALVHRSRQRAARQAHRYQNGASIPPDYERDEKWFSYFKEPIIELKRLSVNDEFVQNARQSTANPEVQDEA